MAVRTTISNVSFVGQFQRRVGIGFLSIYENIMVIKPYLEVYTVKLEVKVYLLTCKYVGRVEV
jgi:hypothetical protein